MSRYVIFYVLFALTVGFVDVTGATATGNLSNAFLINSLCGPVWAWLAALFLPAETIQERLTATISPNE